MLPLYGAIVGAGLGALKYPGDKKDYVDDAAMQAAIEENSYWSKMHGQAPGKGPSLAANVAQGAFAGGEQGVKAEEAGYSEESIMEALKKLQGKLGGQPKFTGSAAPGAGGGGYLGVDTKFSPWEG